MICPALALGPGPRPSSGLKKTPDPLLISLAIRPLGDRYPGFGDGIRGRSRANSPGLSARSFVPACLQV